ncbi:hypothetical protein FA95DRAFT_1612368 [Auriscalpium vulgare]|uniref:Uncharacterized protein n=1 Tax=Auriscalpium vulgare TaxID=40419 RepID=A0ACB8R6F2_9AGAM|nr:hypothetical protein FA95DRAFT_1612368 [Auriscalpium vulgare]
MEVTSSDTYRRSQLKVVRGRNHPYRRNVEVDRDRVLIHRQVFPLALDARDRLRNRDKPWSKVQTEATGISTGNESGPAPALGVALARQPELEACPHTICEEPQTLGSLHRQVDVVAEKSRRVSVSQEETFAIVATVPEFPDVFAEKTSDHVRLYQETQADVVLTPRPVPAALPRLQIPERVVDFPRLPAASMYPNAEYHRLLPGNSETNIYRLPPVAFALLRLLIKTLLNTSAPIIDTALAIDSTALIYANTVDVLLRSSCHCH